MAVLPVVNTEGQQLFDKFIESQGISMPSVAKALGVSHVTVLHWRTGEKRPVEHQRAKIEAWAGIPATAWRTPEENAEIEQVQPYAMAVGS